MSSFFMLSVIIALISAIILPVIILIIKNSAECYAKMQ